MSSRLPTQTTTHCSTTSETMDDGSGTAEHAGSKIGSRRHSRLEADDVIDEMAALKTTVRGEAAAAAKTTSWACQTPLETLITVAACIAYTLSGPCLIFALKLLFMSGFHHAIFTTAITQLGCATFTFVLVRVLCLVPLTVRFTWGEWTRKFGLIGLFVCLSLSTGNSCYRYLSVSFVEMLKGFSPAAILLTSTLAGRPPPSRATTAAIICICIGSCVAAAGEVHLSLFGIGLFAISVFADAAKLVTVGELLSHLELGVFESVHHVSGASSVLLFALSALLEDPHRGLRRWFASNIKLATAPSRGRNKQAMAATRLGEAASRELESTELPVGYVLALLCVCCILVNLTSFLVIKRTDVVMVKLLAISRNALIVVAGVFIFGDVTNSVQMCGYAILLTSFVFFNWLQVRRVGAN